MTNPRGLTENIPQKVCRVPTVGRHKKPNENTIRDFTGLLKIYRLFNFQLKINLGHVWSLFGLTCIQICRQIRQR